jgi:hypothetical protein
MIEMRGEAQVLSDQSLWLQPPTNGGLIYDS